MPLYTKTGDKGQTSLANGSRVSKCSPLVEAYGTIDELNSHIGLLVARLSEPLTDLGNHAQEYVDELVTIQRELFTIGAIVAGNSELLAPDHTHIETAIDNMNRPWNGFTLPGGTPPAAQAHVCRTVCRRAERLIVALDTDVPKLPSSAQPLYTYLNRLSDYFYALALEINRLSGVAELRV